MLEKRPSDRLAERQERRGSAALNRGGAEAKLTARSVVIQRELEAYLAEYVEADVHHFSLYYWRRRSSANMSADMGKMVANVAMPHLGLIACFYDGIESTSCYKVVEAEKARAAKCAENVAAVQEDAAGEMVDLMI